MKLPTDSTERKNTPIYSGCIAYFPLAIAAVSRLSKRGNDKHNPGEPLHWAREKSTDHKDCIARHLVDIDVFDDELQEYDEAAAVAWRALAYLQLLEEQRLAAASAIKEVKLSEAQLAGLRTMSARLASQCDDCDMARCSTVSRPQFADVPRLCAVCVGARNASNEI